MKERARSEFGLRLRAARERAELTQTQVAKAVGMSQGTYAEAEGTAQGSSYTARIARVCGVSAIWLESGEGQMVEAGAWPFGINIDRFLTLGAKDRDFVEQRLEEAIEVCEFRLAQMDDLSGHAFTQKSEGDTTSGPVRKRRFQSEFKSSEVKGSRANRQSGAVPKSRGGRRA